jgi:3',5'-cyclic AMP phosphodiesterase CpdA
MTSGRSYLGTVLTPNGIQNNWYRTQLARGFTQIRSLSTKLPIHSLPLSKRVLIYKTFIRSSHEYLCQLGNLLGTNSLTARNLFRTALKDILLLPPNSDGNLLWIFLKIEPPHHRTTRLQWLWWMKLRGGENITRSLLDNDPLRWLAQLMLNLLSTPNKHSPNNYQILGTKHHRMFSHKFQEYQQGKFCSC